MGKKNNQEAFFAILKAGIWEKECQILPYSSVDFEALRQLAEEQSVIGLIAAGLEHVTDVKVPKADVLQFIGQTLQMEQRNTAMNYFIGVLVDKMKDTGIRTLLVKGQGIAQCYERPLWRSCGDVDFFLDSDNYEKAKSFLIPLAVEVEPEGAAEKHQALTIDSWVVELHGTLHSGLSSGIDKLLDSIMDTAFSEGNVRIWENSQARVEIPRVDEDVLYVFTHIMQHFYKGGIGLRQICDWCRLLWTYRDSLNRGLLESRLRKMRLMSEWRALGAFAVDYLGLSSEAMPLFDNSARWHRKAKQICSFVIKVGNFGHNRDMSYFGKYPYLVRKAISFGRRTGDFVGHFRIFPLDSIRFFPSIVFNGLRSAARGE